MPTPDNLAALARNLNTSGQLTGAGVQASQAEAEAGIDNTKVMSPLRTAQAIAARPSTGGATVTTTATGFALTASSNRLQAVTFTADAQSVTLPDATTITTLGGPIYVISNKGTRPFGVRANSGALLAVVGPGGSAECYLEANGTAAGSWTVNGRELQPALTICDATLSSVYTQSVEVAIRLTDTLSLHFTRNASGHPFVFAVDHGTFPATVGSPALIVASNLDVRTGFRISNTKCGVMVGDTSFYNITVTGTTCTVSTVATILSGVNSGRLPTFTGSPTVAQCGANNDQFVFLAADTNAFIRAQAVDASGTNPVAGSLVNVGASGAGTPMTPVPIACYRVSNTEALAIFIDDPAPAGAPYPVSACVLSLSGTTVTPNTVARVTEVVTDPAVFPSCQLSATSYIVSYYQSSGTLVRAVHIGVSGTTVTFGTPLTVETASLSNLLYTDGNANRFQPNLYVLSGTTALMTYSPGGNASRNVVITNSGGTLTAGTILYQLWASSGGAFPQTSDGFLAVNAFTSDNAILSASITGTNVIQSGQFTLAGFVPESGNTMRFGLTGGVRGIFRSSASGSRGQLHVFRFGPSPRYLGSMSLPSVGGGAPTIPIEMSPARVATQSLSIAQTGSTTQAVKLAILEFPS